MISTPVLFVKVLSPKILVIVTNYWYCFKNMNAKRKRMIASAIAHIFGIFCGDFKANSEL
ncbi:hypothetical protein [Nostoc sp.]